MYGHLNHVPSEFLTKTTLTVLDKHGRTPLHEAAASGYAETIPNEFLTPEFLSLAEKSGGNTILHFLAWRNQFEKIPSNCLTPEIWNLKNNDGQTVRQVFESMGGNEGVWVNHRHGPWAQINFKDDGQRS
jgi:hypothetical protein